VLYASGVFNIICFVAIFQWYKWGFFGYWVSSLVIFVVNLILGSSFLQAAIPLVGVVILFIVPQLGGDRKGWSQLE
jgi:FtsH-binding integral membrane protein